MSTPTVRRQGKVQAAEGSPDVGLSLMPGSCPAPPLQAAARSWGCFELVPAGRREVAERAEASESPWFASCQLLQRPIRGLVACKGSCARLA